jgi:hypothetical protein
MQEDNKPNSEPASMYNILNLIMNSVIYTLLCIDFARNRALFSMISYMDGDAESLDGSNGDLDASNGDSNDHHPILENDRVMCAAGLDD